MISELVLARHNGTFWNSLLPGSDDYVRLINSGFATRFESSIDIPDNPQRRAYVNNVSFALFEAVSKSELTPSALNSVNGSTPGIEALLAAEKHRLSNMRYGQQLGLNLDPDEWSIAKIMAQRLVVRYGKQSGLQVRPVFPGCGVLFEAAGDIHYRDTLVEVKAGARPISVYDLRQLYVYAALNYRAKRYKILTIEICNPRTGFEWHQALSIVSENVAGTASVEIFHEIIDFVSSEYRSL